MSETRGYSGSCHCQRVRYEANIDLSKPVISCNCSICGRSGSLLAFIPVEDFRLLSGADSLVDYQFNKHLIQHHFCKVCGVKSFARGKRPDGVEMVAINTRCLDNVDVAGLTITQFDGKSR